MAWYSRPGIKRVAMLLVSPQEFTALVSGVDQAAVVECIAMHPVLEDRLLIQDAGAVHLQRLEDPLGQKLGVPLSADLLDNHPQQEVAFIAVLPPLSRRKVNTVFCRRGIHGG